MKDSRLPVHVVARDISVTDALLHDGVRRVSGYHPRVWLTLESVYAVLTELPPERWPEWAVALYGAYTSDFLDSEHCCGPYASRCTGGLLELDAETRAEVDAAYLALVRLRTGLSTADWIVFRGEYRLRSLG